MQMTISQQLGLELNTVSNFFMNARRRCMNRWQEEPGTTPGVPSSSTSTFSKAWSFTPRATHPYIPLTPHSKALIPFAMRAMHTPCTYTRTHHATTSCGLTTTLRSGCFGMPQSPRGGAQQRPPSETLWMFTEGHFHHSFSRATPKPVEVGEGCDSICPPKNSKPESVRLFSLCWWVGERSRSNCRGFKGSIFHVPKLLWWQRNCYHWWWLMSGHLRSEWDVCLKKTAQHQKVARERGKQKSDLLPH